jgi:hypothetical protein
MTIETKYDLETVVFYLEGGAVYKGVVSGITVDYSADSTIIKYRLTTLKGVQLREETLLATNIDAFIEEM